MLRPILCLCAALAMSSAMGAEEGDIYAEVSFGANGGMRVDAIHTRLPADVEPAVKGWLLRQPLVLPADDSASRILQVHYRVLEDAGGTQSLAMEIVDTSAELPAIYRGEVPVRVSVHLLASGEVAEVTPLDELPAGIDTHSIQQAIVNEIENDAAIRAAADAGALEETTTTMTVRVRPAQD